MIFIDTHAHINFNHFENDMLEVIDHSITLGVKRIILPAVDLETSQAVVEMSVKYDNLYAAVGFHPNEANKWTLEIQSVIEKLLQHPKVIAIGEIGLDNYRQNCPIDIQKVVFKSQLELAGKYRLPVIIHNRNAFAEIWSIYQSFKQQFHQEGNKTLGASGIFHAFSESLDVAQEVVQHGFFLGIGGTSTYHNSTNIQEVIRNMPLESMVLETDSPYLPPHPHRGERNEPSYVPIIAQKIADIKNIPLVEVAKITTDNTIRLFNWSANFE